MENFGVVVNSKKNGKLYSKYIRIMSVIANDFEEARQYIEDEYNLVTYNSYIEALENCNE